MNIFLDHHSGEPIYRQIVEAIKLRIATGELTEGTKLPSIRKLSSQLQINMRTVGKAYDELNQAGLVVLQQGRGAFVTAPQAVLPQKERRKFLREQARRLLAEASRVGATPEEVIEIIQSTAYEMGARHN